MFELRQSSKKSLAKITSVSGTLVTAADISHRDGCLLAGQYGAARSGHPTTPCPWGPPPAMAAASGRDVVDGMLALPKQFGPLKIPLSP